MASIPKQVQATMQEASSSTYVKLAISSAAILLVYTLTTALYRLCYSPLAHFPGPKIAAATGWYEFYFDVIKRGQYVFEIERMHQKYGNTLRH